MSLRSAPNYNEPIFRAGPDRSVLERSHRRDRRRVHTRNIREAVATFEVPDNDGGIFAAGPERGAVEV